MPKGNELSRGKIDEYTKFVGIYGARGLAYIKVNDASKLLTLSLPGKTASAFESSARRAISIL